MPVSGFKRYIKLAQNIHHPLSYFVYKWGNRKKPFPVITKPNAIRFEVVKSIYLVFKEIFMQDVYDIDQLVKKLPPNPQVIDIGANVGFFDILLLSKLPGAVITAYEPLEQNAAYFKNVLANNPVLKQVSYQTMAVTGKPVASIELFAENTDDSQVVASFIEGFNENNTQKINVPAISLTNILEEKAGTVIDVLKMDCEGSEYDIVYNTDSRYFEKIKYMLIEVHNLDEQQNNITAFLKHIQQLGFSTTHAPINGFCYAVEAVNTRF